MAFFTMASVAMTWPLATNLATATAFPGDPLINTWILDWDWYATLHKPLRLFEAPIFYPAKHALAFSEHLYGIALFAFPLRALGMAPLTAHNVLLLLGFLLTGYGAFVLAETVTGSWGASLVSGTALTFIPWRFTHLTHLQHEWVVWLPLMIAALLWFQRKPSWGRSAIFGAAFLMNGLTNLHWFAFGSLAIALSAVFIVQDRRMVVRLAIATLAAALLLVPFMLPYRAARKLYGMRGDPAETLRYSATWSDWLSTNFSTRSHMLIHWNDGTTVPERWLFPGFLILILAALSVRARCEEVERRTFAVALLWLALGLLGSLGLHAFFHTALFEHVELFKGIRAPARWAMIAYVALALLAGIGSMTLLRRLSERWRSATGIAIVLLLMIELRAAPIRYRLLEPQPPPVYAALANRNGATLELPVDAGWSEYATLLHATVHHRPIVNGVSGFVPPVFVEVSRRFQSDLIPDDTLSFLESLGVATIIVHADTLESQDATVRAWLRREVSEGGLRFIARYDSELKGDWLFALAPGVLASAGKAPGAGAPHGVSIDADLQRFLEGKPTDNHGLFGVIDSPREGERVQGRLRICGWALGRMAIVRVNIRLANGARRYQASFSPRPDVIAAYQREEGGERAGFFRDFERPPGAIDGPTDVQIEIVDAAGRTTRLHDVWFEWSAAAKTQ
ncbi:MAG: hypothetical protein ABI837_03560 [Acidobacteriota bacterium]